MIQIDKETKETFIKTFPEGSFQRTKLEDVFDRLEDVLVNDIQSESDPHAMVKLSGMLRATKLIRKVILN